MGSWANQNVIGSFSHMCVNYDFCDDDGDDD